ncbi:MAG: MTAP family purine nucleoside phosphorylase [Gammaproteobacteria bacterium]|nr:MTAP family purine nucleoside phosphorylase [Gammaproteobacteria bacterium]
MIGIIGGTGLYRMEGLEVTRSAEIDTPFGAPSGPVMLGRLAGRDIAFLPRHGLHHDLLPSEINFRANIWALKAAGVRTIIGVSAVGSLREEIRPGDLALPSQYLDFTKGLRAASFFGKGLVAHVSTAHPTWAHTAALIARVAKTVGQPIHRDRTYACVEGPRLGTRAESFWLRGAGADLVGMTNVPEAFLALEAQVGYCVITVATDYDCWLDDASQHVSAEQVIGQFRESLGRVQRLIAGAVAEYVEDESRPCRRALEAAVVTPREQMSAEQKKVLDFLAS